MKKNPPLAQSENEIGKTISGDVVKSRPELATVNK